MLYSTVVFQNDKTSLKRWFETFLKENFNVKKIPTLVLFLKNNHLVHRKASSLGRYEKMVWKIREFQICYTPCGSKFIGLIEQVLEPISRGSISSQSRKLATWIMLSLLCVHFIARRQHSNILIQLKHEPRTLWHIIPFVPIPPSSPSPSHISTRNPVSFILAVTLTSPSSCLSSNWLFFHNRIPLSSNLLPIPTWYTSPPRSNFMFHRWIEEQILNWLFLLRTTERLPNK